MTPAHHLLLHCRAAGLTLQRNGAHLSIRPVRLVTPDLLVALRAHKPALLLMLEAEAARLPHDCGPWLHVARQVLAGEFDGGDRSLLESLFIGVRSIPHPSCQQARARLETMLSRHYREARR
jgi:hypothetical protein